MRLKAETHIIATGLLVMLLVTLVTVALFVPLDAGSQTTPPVTPPAPPRWVFERPPPQDPLNREFQEVATFTVEVGKDYTHCWYNPITKRVGTKDVEETALTITHRRYRVEGGKLEEGAALPFADWQPERAATGLIIPKKYCAVMKGIPRAGHWVMEAQICRVPAPSLSDCSAWMSSIQRYTPSGGGGTISDTPRGWWLYAYLPAPTGVGT